MIYKIFFFQIVFTSNDLMHIIKRHIFFFLDI